METRLPQQGRSAADVKAAVNRARDDDPSWDNGAFNIWWPMKPDELGVLVADVTHAYEHANQLFAPDAAGLHRLTTELRSMIADVLHSPPGAGVTLTGGGTESNFLAVQAMREWGRREKGVQAPNLVIPHTAHPSFDKAGFLLGVEVIRVPVSSDYRADADAMSRAISGQTIGVVASAPSYSHGVVDHVAQVSEMAAVHAAWMHVDACVGGFLLPFLRENGHSDEEFDFVIPGVRSVSADLHKFGYCPHGISSLTMRSADDIAFHTWKTTSWPAGTYVRGRFAGSAPATPVVGAWATMQFLGRDGYQDIAKSISANGAFLKQGVRDIDGISLLRDPDAGIIVFVGDPGFSIPALVAAMRARGRSTYWIEDPPGVHMLLDPVDQPVLERYLTDLSASAEDVRSGRVGAVDTFATYGSAE